MTDSRRLNVVLDTNVLLVSVSSRSKYHWLFRDLLDSKYELSVTTEILGEYEEIIGEKLSSRVAEETIRTLILLPNVRKIQPSYRWHLISEDPDDNKFIDCFVAAGAHVLVTHDRHFNVLRTVDFPQVTLMNIAEFEELATSWRSGG